MIIRTRVTQGVALALVLGCARSPDESAAQQANVTTNAARASISQSRQTAITAAVTAVAPSVVTVQTSRIEREAVDPFSAFFFGAQPRTRATPGLGTGFIVRGDGVVVTNAHVIAGTDDISVMLRDGTVLPARVLGTDETNDIAVLKIDSEGLPVVKVGNSANLLMGEWAIAIGNPYGIYLGNSEPSVTAGVVSGVGRNLIGRGEGPALYFDMIQTDAAINPGNSGGPLVNADGEVIGMASSIYSTSGGSIGLGFAIPINRVVRVVDDLLTHGSIRRPWIGVYLTRTSPNAREVLASGATVASVAEDSPARRAGIQPGDVILRAGDRPIRNAYDWDAAQLDFRVGESAELVIGRGNRQINATVRVADLPEVTAPKVEVLRELELVTLTPAIRAERGVRAPAGALIYGVAPRLAAELGIQRGDVVIGVNNMPVASADDAKRAIEYFGGRGPIRMYIEREGQNFFTDFVIR